MCCCADLEQDAAAGIDDFLEELAELCGVDLHDSDAQDAAAGADSEADKETQQELQRLLEILHKPVQPGAEYTVLQVRGLWCPADANACTAVVVLCIIQRQRLMSLCCSACWSIMLCMFVVVSFML
jgi:hypothetical protein